MLDVPVIRELYRYNSWANSRLFHPVAHLARMSSPGIASSYLCFARRFCTSTRLNGYGWSVGRAALRSRCSRRGTSRTWPR